MSYAGVERVPSGSDYRRVKAERDALAARLASVKALHYRCGPERAVGYCHECVTSWPCDTICALGSDAHTERKGTGE